MEICNVISSKLTFTQRGKIETPAGWSIRGKRADADGAAYNRGEPVQVADRAVSRSHQVSGGGAGQPIAGGLTHLGVRRLVAALIS